MTEPKTSWIQAIIASLVMLGVISGMWMSANSEAAVRSEQIRTIQSDARDIEAYGKKNADHIRLVEREVDGLKPAMEAIKAIADSNALKLDRLLSRNP
jgi:hypothetical protein